MEKNTPLWVPLKEALTIPRHNYRNITKEFQKELEAFALRLTEEGQLTAIRIATIDDTVTDEQLIQLCGENKQLLIDGERRLLSMEIANLEKVESCKEVKVEYIPVTALREYLALQMAYNMDRKNTSFTEDGKGFKRFLENGGTKMDLFKVINFPPDVLSKKARLKYINERIDLIGLNENLYPFLDNGLIRAHKSKPHQGHIILGFSEVHQQALAKEYQERPSPKTDDGIRGFFNSFRVAFKDVPFAQTDEGLGIKRFGTGACTGCKYLMTIEEKDWNDKMEKNTYCYLRECFQEKTQLQVQQLIEQVEAQDTPFVILGYPDGGNHSYPNNEQLENGMTKIRDYLLVEPGSCSHAVIGIPDAGNESSNIPQGVIHYVCPAASNCIVHHPARIENKEATRNVRLEKERTTVEKRTTILTAREWGRTFITSDHSKLEKEIHEEYLYYSFELFYRSFGVEEKKTFLGLLDIDEKKGFAAYGQEMIRKNIAEFGLEKCWKALILSFLFHDYDRHWGLMERWGEMSGVDFTTLLKQNMEMSLEELEEKHQKRKAGWQKQKEIIQKHYHALLFDLPLFYNLFDWDNSDELEQVLLDEVKGRKICRLVGVKLVKDAAYIPSMVTEKILGRIAELQRLLPKYKLPKEEVQLINTHITTLTETWEKMIPEAYLDKEGITWDFIQKATFKAIDEDSRLAFIEFICAKVKSKEIVFPLLHKDTFKMIQQTLKAESLNEKCVISKPDKTIRFITT